MQPTDVLTLLLDGNAAERRQALQAMRRPEPQLIERLQNALLREPLASRRKHAAVALGRLGAGSSDAALVQALASEQDSWIRCSVLLALGSVGGEAARVALEAYQPQDEAELEALRKALGKVKGAESAVQWKGGAIAGVLFEVPVGLEDVALRDARASHGELRIFGRGLLVFRDAVVPTGLLNTTRCAYGVRLLLGEAPVPDAFSPAAVAEPLQRLVEQSAVLGQWPNYIEAPSPALSYRFDVEGRKVDRGGMRDLLARLRPVLKAKGLFDNPSGYSIEIILRVTDRQLQLFLVPAYERDDRYSYRVTDVGASINPTVAACLARLAPPGGAVVDPTCGSGTMLIERAIYDRQAVLTGMDISPTAVSNAGKNVRAAELAQRIAIRQADSALPSAWSPCRLVLANLPFGIRARVRENDMADLYARLLANAVNSLEQNGMLVLYTASRTAMLSALKRQKAKLEVGEPLSCLSGGLTVYIWVARKR